MKRIRDFDQHGTTPLYGFESAEDYYFQTSSKRYFHKIQVPTLLIQAKDDPVLGPKCYLSSSEIPSDMTYVEEILVVMLASYLLCFLRRHTVKNWCVNISEIGYTFLPNNLQGCKMQYHIKYICSIFFSIYQFWMLR